MWRGSADVHPANGAGAANDAGGDSDNLTDPANSGSHAGASSLYTKHISTNNSEGSTFG